MAGVFAGVLLLVEVDGLLFVIPVVSNLLVRLLSRELEFIVNRANEAGNVLGLHFVRSKVVCTRVEQLVGFECELATQLLGDVESFLLHCGVLEFEHVRTLIILRLVLFRFALIEVQCHLFRLRRLLALRCCQVSPFDCSFRIDRLILCLVVLS